MDDLLKEAIADAKAVRETALANAKMALEEAFTPRLKSMLAKKIQHEIEDEDGDAGEEEVTEDAPLEDEGEVEDPANSEAGGPVSEEDEISDEDDEVEPVAPVEPEEEEPVAEEEEVSDEDEDEPVAEEEEISDEDDETVDELDLEAILRELEEEDDEEEVSEEYEDEDTEDGHEEVSENDVSSDIGDADNKVNDDANDSSETGAQGPEGEGSDSESGKENDDDTVAESEAGTSIEDDEPQKEAEVDTEDIDLEEVLKALSEEDEEEDSVEEVAKLKKEVKEHRDVVKYLRSKLNEVNLLNAKLLFTNKLFRAYGLSNEQKMKVVETFDRAKNLREIKLVFSTLAESFGQTKSKPIKESKGSSSKAVASTKPVKEVISEGADVKARFKKLANII
jgi:hypothetical protein